MFLPKVTSALWERCNVVNRVSVKITKINSHHQSKEGLEISEISHNQSDLFYGKADYCDLLAVQKKTTRRWNMISVKWDST